MIKNLKPLFVVRICLIFSLQLLHMNSCKTPAKAQEDLKLLMQLPDVLKECSGMVELDNQHFVALNDGGNKPHLYIFNKTGKKETRTIKVKNVENHDWEELTDDEDFIYIGDFGNNEGTRKNLMIYKISRKDLISGVGEVNPQIISFKYKDQTKFKESQWTNFDCEAMTSKGDSLYLFTKNRGDFRTDVYGLPKAPGDYVISSMGSFDTEGLVTGADYMGSETSGELVLVGYSIHGKAVYPFILHFPEVRGSRFLDGKFKWQKFTRILQTESIMFSGQDKVFITNETKGDTKASIFEVSLKN